MEFRIINITAASNVRVKSATLTSVIVPTRELLELGEDEVGFMEGRFSHHQKGVYFQGGILNPGWKGRVTAEFLVFGEFEITEGEQVAHAIILKGENVLGYVFKGLGKWQDK